MCPKCGQEPCKCKKIILTAPFDEIGVPSGKIRFVKQSDDKETLEISPRRKKRKITAMSPKNRYEMNEEFEEKLITSRTSNLEYSNDILSLAKKLKSVKTDDLKGNAAKISDYIKEFKHFLNLAKMRLTADDSAISLFDKLIITLDHIDANKVKSIPRNIIKLAAQIRKKVQKGVAEYGNMV